MMKESKLTNFQRRTLSASAKGGKSLPTVCNPTSSKVKNESPSPAKCKTQPLVMNGRHLALSGKRPKEVIESMVEKGIEDVYRPLPSKAITEKDKRKLQNKMAYGVDVPDVDPSKRKQAPIVDEIEVVDEFDEILGQIEERRQFLQDMEALGQGKKYRTIVRTEISQKIRELKLIDQKRTGELELALKDTEKQQKT